MLSSRLNCLFVHVPKTGGNSIQDVLAPFADDRRVILSGHQDGVERFEVRHSDYPTTKHSTLSEYRSHYPSELFEQLFKFAVVRNTYERALSYYFSPHRGSVAWNDDSFLNFCRAEVKPLRHYIAFPGQVLEQAVSNLDALLRFEQIDQEFCHVARRIGLACSALPRRNVGPQRASAELSPRITSAIRELYSEEIDYFSFQPPARYA
jgi:hypothetical protein